MFDFVGGLRKGWIRDLLSKLSEIDETRRKEIRRLTEVVAGEDPFILTARYIPPYVQTTNPADLDEDTRHTDEDLSTFSTRFNIFVERPCRTKDGRHVLFLLGDAGMGKTSALVMLRLTQLKGIQLKNVWPRSLRFELRKLGPGVLADIGALKNTENTILLLDSLDEDKGAFENVEKRLLNILEATKSFRQVVITCRTQFFPQLTKFDPQQRIYERRGRFEVGGYLCQLLYLTPFSNEQVREYLEQIFIPCGEDFDRAFEIVNRVSTLVNRPLLLAYIEDLIEYDENVQTLSEVYAAMVTHWLRREVDKLQRKGIWIERPALQRVCQNLAHSMLVNQDTSISASEIKNRMSLEALNLITPIDIGGRSLLNRKSDGSYRFAHQTIKEFLAHQHVMTERIGTKPLQESELINAIIRESLSANNSVIPRIQQLSVLRHNLQRVNLQGVILQGANFQGANLQGASLQGANLQGANLQGANLQGASLQGANLQGADLQRAHLQGADLRRADLFGSLLQATILESADLQQTNLQETNLEGAQLQRANLRGACIQGAALRQANLTGAFLQGANLHKADLSGAHLQRADLVGADCQETNFQRAGLQGTDLSQTDFLGANLFRANLQGANMELANLRDVDLGRSYLCSAKGLTQAQIQLSVGSCDTLLPNDLEYPDHWLTEDTEAVI